jgi:putative transcriptional regulator
MQQEELQLQNQLLIAMPGMADRRFEHAVILIARHNPDGCFGVVINQPTNTLMGDLFEHLKISSLDTNLAAMPVLKGGPVQPEQGFVVHDSDRVWENTLRISDNLAVTASKDILTDIASGQGPENFVLTLGCVSWSRGQIEEEMMDNTWLSCPTESSIIFDMPYPQRWQNSSRSLGIDVSLMSDTSGHA